MTMREWKGVGRCVGKGDTEREGVGKSDCETGCVVG